MADVRVVAPSLWFLNISGARLRAGFPWALTPRVAGVRPSAHRRALGDGAARSRLGGWDAWGALHGTRLTVSLPSPCAAGPASWTAELARRDVPRLLRLPGLAVWTLGGGDHR